MVDIWDGSVAQCRFFEQQAGLSQPMLMLGGRTTGTARSFDAELEHYFVIDGSGVILYERNRADGATDNLPPWREDEIGAAIDAALTALPARETTFDGLKALYR